jgi:hypothetical protein
MRVQGSPGCFIPDFGSCNDRGICCVDAGFPNRRRAERSHASNQSAISWVLAGLTRLANPRPPAGRRAASSSLEVPS